MGSIAYNPQDIAEMLALEGAICETVMQRALQVQSPCTKIPMDAAGRDGGMLEVHGAQAHGCWGGGFIMLPVL